jgi:hypothetical protein
MTAGVGPEGARSFRSCPLPPLHELADVQAEPGRRSVIQRQARTRQIPKYFVHEI